MALTVVLRSGDLPAPAAITFDAPRIVIGRGDGCEVRLPDPSISHRHASIRQRGTDYVIIDEGSTNGTFVGPVRLSPQAPRMIRSVTHRSVANALALPGMLAGLLACAALAAAGSSPARMPTRSAGEPRSMSCTNRSAPRRLVS